MRATTLNPAHQSYQQTQSGDGACALSLCRRFLPQQQNAFNVTDSTPVTSYLPDEELRQPAFRRSSPLSKMAHWLGLE
jgi:hypothetical protein